MRRRRPAEQSPGSCWLTRPDGTGSGWHDGCAPVGSRRISSIQQVSRSRASTAGLKRIASTPRCSCGCSWAGCGERRHCSMVAIPTLEEEDAKRPSREREGLVGERTRIINRMKATLARLGVRGFKPTLRKAPERLEALRTAEGAPLPPNTLAELRRDMARLRLVRDQIAQVEAARLERLGEEPGSRPHAMVRLLARVVGVGVET